MLTKSAFSPSERRILSKLNSPRKIQDFLDELPYNLEERGETYHSPRNAFANNTSNFI